jgi:molecular chaperone GrpE
MEHPEDSEFDPTSADYRDSRAPDSDDDFVRGGQSAGSAPLDDAGEGVSAPAADLVRRFSEQQDKYLRLAAEYENFRKRTARERTETTARAQADVVKQLLDGLDDLSRFAHVDPVSVDAVTLVQGVQMVEKKMLKALANAGLEIVDPVDQTFDPKLHEAVTTEPALSPEDDHVVARVYQVGYLFNGQLLRPARVVVKQWNG